MRKEVHKRKEINKAVVFWTAGEKTNHEDTIPDYLRNENSQEKIPGTSYCRELGLGKARMTFPKMGQGKGK